MNTEKLLKIAINAAKQAGSYLRNLDERVVIKDLDKDVKLKADLESEKIIFNYLLKTDFSILSEESPKIEKKSEFCWIVDPLDGTVNFLRRIPFNSISIALYKGNKPILGVVYDFNRDELFTGIVGNGAKLNNKEIMVSPNRYKRDSIIMAGSNSDMVYEGKTLSEFIRRFKDFKKNRILGSAALSICYVAAGRGEVFVEEGVKFWDVAAGLAILQSAGGKFNLTKLKKGFLVHASNGNLVL